MKNDILEIGNLWAEAKGKQILKGLNLKIKSGEIHAVMGPNGSGKSTLCNVIMNHPDYTVVRGSIKFNGKSILNLDTAERAQLGLFMGFQNPLEIPGVNFFNFLRAASSGSNLSTEKFLKLVNEKANDLKIKDNILEKNLNEGFSGGERKKAEIMQMAVLGPRIALLDEIDSGLDIDALKIVAKNIKKIFEKTNPGILLITHYQRILNYITPDFVHIISDGKIIKSGKKDLALKLEKHGYNSL